MRAAGHETRDMRHVRHDRRGHRIGDFSNTREIDPTWIGTRSDDNQLRPMLDRQPRHLIVVETLIFPPNSIGHNMIEPAGEIEWVPVCEMTAMGEIHPHERLAWVEKRHVDGHVGLGPAMRLHVGVLCSEELSGALDGEPLDDVDDLAAAVVTPARVPFSVLVGEYRARGLEDGWTGEILGSDEL